MAAPEEESCGGRQLTEKFEKIIFISQARLGDTLFATPAVRYLSKVYTFARIDVLAPTFTSYQVWQGSPYLSRFDLCDSPQKLNTTLAYDLAVAPYDNEFSRDCAKKIAKTHWLKSDTRKLPPSLDMLEFLAEKTGVPHVGVENYDLFPQPKHHAQVAEKLAALGETNRLVACQIACHGVEKSARKWFHRKRHPKTWPPRYYRKFASGLLESCEDVSLLMVGSEREAPLVRSLCKAPNVHDFSGLDVLALKVLIQRSALFISPDTGPLHVACTTNTPLIGMYAATDPFIFGPPPCKQEATILYGNPITTITPEILLDCVLSWLDQTHTLSINTQRMIFLPPTQSQATN